MLEFGALLVFVVVSIASSLVAPRITRQRWNFVEYAIVAAGIIAILAALAQVRADKRKDHLHELAAEAQTKLHDLFRSTDYLLHECGVDRTYVIDQTNEDPPACEARNPKRDGQSCKMNCRVGHLVWQLPEVVSETDVNLTQVESLQLDLCREPLNQKLGICEPATAYLSAVHNLDSAIRQNKDLLDFSSGLVLTISQYVLAVFLGLQIGKTTRDLRRRK